MLFISKSSRFQAGLWSRSQKIEWWSRSLKYEFLFNRHSLWSKQLVQITQCLLVFIGPNRSGAGAKNFGYLELEPVSSEISDLCEISDLLLFFSYFLSESNGIKFGNYFFDVCCVH